MQSCLTTLGRRSRSTVMILPLNALQKGGSKVVSPCCRRCVCTIPHCLRAGLGSPADRAPLQGHSLRAARMVVVESPSNRGVDRFHLPTSLDNALAYVLWRLIQAGTGKKSALRRCGLCRRFFFSSEESGDGAPPNRSRRCACQAQAAPSSVAEQRSDRTGDERAPALQRRRREFSHN